MIKIAVYTFIFLFINVPAWSKEKIISIENEQLCVLEYANRRSEIEYLSSSSLVWVDFENENIDEMKRIELDILSPCKIMFDERNAPITWKLDRFLIFYIESIVNNEKLYYSLLYDTWDKRFSIKHVQQPNQLCVFEYTLLGEVNQIELNIPKPCKVVVDENGVPITWSLDNFLIFYIESVFNNETFYHSLLYNSIKKKVLIDEGKRPRYLATHFRHFSPENIKDSSPPYIPKSLSEFLRQPAIEKFPYAIYWSFLMQYYSDSSDIAKGEIKAKELPFEYNIE